MKAIEKATDKVASEHITFAGSKHHDIFNWNSNVNAHALQSKIEEHLAVHKTVQWCVRCLACGQPRNQARMSAIAGICRECIVAGRNRGLLILNNFIERLKANVGRFLRGYLA